MTVPWPRPASPSSATTEAATYALRLALDHPGAWSASAALLDCLPDRRAPRIAADARFATAWWHWFFFAQPDGARTASIGADPDAWYHFGDPSAMGADNARRVPRRRCRDPDGRARHARGLPGRPRRRRRRTSAPPGPPDARLRQPLLVLWSLRDDLEDLLRRPPRLIWHDWADDVSGHGIDGGHHVAEEAPEDLVASLVPFLLGDGTPDRSTGTD